jgi:hypothetical protein
MKPILAALMALLLIGGRSYARNSASSASHHSASSHTYHARAHSTRSYSDVPRDRHGRIRRSEAAKRDFERQTGYPHGRPGYVVDHIKPLACGGADDPSNMQWQTTADAKAKDKWERKGCQK